MNSYRCVQCNLVNWTTQQFCKRCQSPNPYLNPQMQLAETQIPVNNFVQTAPIMPDYSAPPPPNVFGSAVGTTTMDGFQQFPPPAYANHQPVRPAFQPTHSPEELEELRKAEKHIRNAWICGVIICTISTLLAIVFSSASSGKDVLPVSPFEIMIGAVIFGGLTLGVYFKSRVCSVLLCVLFVIDKILTMASSGKFSGGLLAFILIYYFIYGIQGTFTYHRLKR